MKHGVESYEFTWAFVKFTPEYIAKSEYVVLEQKPRKTNICTMTEFPFTVTEHVIDTQYIREYPHATTVPDAPLKLLVKKYTPVDNPNPQPGDVTLIGAPGTGYPKVSPIFNAMTT